MSDWWDLLYEAPVSVLAIRGDLVVLKLELDHAIIAADITTTGNTSAASIPLAIDTLLATEPDARGALAVLVGFGAGLSYAAQVALLPVST